MNTKTVIQQFHRLLHVNPPLWRLTVLGAIITSIPWFFTLLATSRVMKYGIEAAIKGRNFYTIALLVIISIILLHIPVILGYALNSWTSEKLSEMIQNKMICS